MTTLDLRGSGGTLRLAPNGGSATVRSFLVLGPTGLQGPAGATGPQGLQGATGPAGATGLQGLQGAQGLQGPQGLPGVNAVPADNAVAGYVTGPSSTATALSASISAALGVSGLGYSIPAQLTPLTSAVAAIPSAAIAFPAVASSPPTMTITEPTDTSATPSPISGAAFAPCTASGLFTMRSGVYATASNNSLTYLKNVINDPSTGYPPAVVEFEYTGSDVAIGYLNNSVPGAAAVDIEVDGVPQMAAPVGSVGTTAGLAWFRVQLGSARRRKIKATIHGGLFYGISYPITALPAAVTDKKVRCAVYGDSWVGGANSVADAALWRDRACRALGWEMYPLGQGGSAYTRPGSGANEAYTSPTRIARLAATNADVALIYGSQNDDTVADDATYNAATLGFFAAVAAAAPRMRLIVIGPPRLPDGIPTRRMRNNELLRSATLGSPNVIGYIDQIGGTTTTPAWANSTAYAVGALVTANTQTVYRCSVAHTSAATGTIDLTKFNPVSWFTGTGNVTTPAGNGNTDLFINADNAHMEPAGHDYFAGRVASEITAILKAWVAGQIVTSTTSLSISPASGTAAQGDAVTLTASVSPFIPGVVNFFDGTTPLGSGVVNKSGVATLATTSITAGSRSVSASFVPSDTSKFSGSSSSAVAYIVNPPPLSDIITTNLLAEFDASQITGISDGATVATWTRKRGTKAADLAQASAGNRPTYQAAGLAAGKPSVRFNLTNKTFLDADWGGDTAIPLTVFVVHKETSATGGAGIIFDGPPVNGAFRANAGISGTNVHVYSSGSTSLQNLQGDPVASTTPHVDAYVYNGTSSFSWHNTRTKNAAKSTGATATAGLSGLRVGANNTATATVSGSNFNGDVSHVVVYSGVMADTDVTSMMTFLATKWGVTLSG